MKNCTKDLLLGVISRYPALEGCKNDIVGAADIIIECYNAGRKLLICGNGGSAADSLHIVGELMKAFVLPRRLSGDIVARLNECGENAQYLTENLQGALPAISLVNEVSLSTAYANDMAADLGFAQQVYGLGQQDDVFIGISTSGNSKNVIYASEVAKAKGMRVIGLTGETGGKQKDVSDITIKVPENETYKIQELHLPVYHALCLAVEYEFFG